MVAMFTNPIGSYARFPPVSCLWGSATGKRGAQLYEALSQHRTASIRAISGNRAEQIGYYRWLRNDDVTLDEVVESPGVDCQGHLVL